MADFSAFAEEDFDPKEWVNNICAQKPNGKEIDNFLSEMEMRLQLEAESIESELQESSSQAMRRIPFAVQEIYRLQGDIQGMQDQVKVLSSNVAQSASLATNSVSHIRELDSVKRNMETACNTLREATELSGMFTKVESVFASGDLPRVAELLKSMRASLALVGDVPEFREGRGKLKTLEDRLQSRVEGALATALAAAPQPADLQGADTSDADRDAEAESRTRSLCELLLAVDRYKTIEKLYTDSQLARVQAIWDTVCGSQGGTADKNTTRAQHVQQWLPSLYGKLLPFLKTQVAWIGRVLPAHKNQLIKKLFNSVLDKVGKSITQRLLSGSLPMTSLITLLSTITSFATSAADLLPSDLGPTASTALLSKALEPLENVISRYPDMEAKSLNTELQSAVPPAAEGKTAPDGKALVRQLWDAVRAATSLCCAAIERCVTFTGGSELPALASVLDEVLAGLLSRVASAASHATTKSTAALTTFDTSLGMDESNEGSSMVLSLVVLANEILGGALLRKVDAALRAALSNALPKLEAAAGTSDSLSTQQPSHVSNALVPPTPSMHHGRASTAAQSAHSVDPLVLRLRSNPDCLQRVQKLSANMSDHRYNLLPTASAKADAFVKSTQAAALDTLLSGVKAALQPMPTLSQWRQGSSGGSGFALPSFSVEPLSYVTHMGDYLMMLPQQLEVLFGDEVMTSTMTQDEQDDLAAQWLDYVVAGAGSAYADAIARIPELSQQGSVQLAADAEYFCNVMSALHVAPPPALLTIQLYAGMPDNEFPSAAKAALADGGDAGTLRLLASLRHLQIPS